VNAFEVSYEPVLNKFVVVAAHAKMLDRLRHQTVTCQSHIILTAAGGREQAINEVTDQPQGKAKT
jgi:hypothetical protein